MKSVKSTVALSAAVAGALAFATAVTVAPAQAAKVKCYGIAKAGQNDCGNAAGTHSCAGQSKVSYDGGEWKSTQGKAACLKAGGSLKPFEGVNPKMKGKS